MTTRPEISIIMSLPKTRDDMGSDEMSVLQILRNSISDGRIRPGGRFSLVRTTRVAASGDNKVTDSISSRTSGFLQQTETDNDRGSGTSQSIAATDVHLLCYGGGHRLSVRDEENLQDDLSRILVTYLSQSGALSDRSIDLEVEYNLNNGQPGLWIVNEGHRPIAVLEYPHTYADDIKVAPALGSRDMGVSDGGFYVDGNPHVVIEQLRNQPGTSVLVLLSPLSRSIMAVEGATVSALEACEHYDCCRVACAEHVTKGETRYRLRFYNCDDTGALEGLVLPS